MEKNSKVSGQVAGVGCAIRRCPRCGYVVADPMVGRCPRCWEDLPSGGCEGCAGCSLHPRR